MCKLKRWVLPALAGLLFFTLGVVPGALAQGPVDDRLANLSVNVWPEYDQPSVLVLYEGEMAAKDKFPRDVSFLVPTGAQVVATAYVGTSGDLLNTDAPKIQDQGDGYTLLTISLPQSKFHIEYYYNPLQGSPDKTMTFVYKAAQSADNIDLEVQQPLKAENFVTDPAAIVKSTDPHGFVLHKFSYATLAMGKTLSVKVSYTKSDPNPSTSALPAPNPSTAPSQSGANAPASSSLSNTEVLAGILIALALAVAALGGFYWWSRNRLAPEPEPAAAPAGG
ncbi:MAG: hypothetical protein WCF84_18555, partial [Anaerolineae bacterium]